jgi:hypothetical protein
MNYLTVSDVERLAKAGVKIEFNDVRDQVTQDPNPPIRVMMPEPSERPTTLDEAFWQRWHRAHISNAYSYALPFQIHATEFKDKVYVFVAPTTAEPFVLTDEAPLYPSDKLMAELALWESTNK